MHRAGIGRGTARRAVIKRRTHGQPVARRVQRHRGAELIVRTQRADIDIPAAGIATAHCRGQRAAGEIPIGKSEQIHRAAPERPGTVMENGTDGQAVTGRVQ